MRGPLLTAWRQRLRNQLAAEGPWSWVVGALGPIVATALLVPLFRPVFLGFLASPAHLVEGTYGVTIRAALVVAGWMALDAHQVVLRTGDRPVLAGLPVDPAEVVRYELLRLLAARWWLVPAAAALLSPIAGLDPVLWTRACLVLLSGWLLAAPTAAAGALLAIEAADSPAWAPLLDALRGHGPRAQAALIWAPGLVLAVVGGLLLQLAGVVLAGGSLVWLALPPLLAAGMIAALPGLARRSWFRGTAVLAEIDARFANLEGREEATRVYLDWAVRWLSPTLARWALLDLRHGWRGRRSWISAAWLVGVAALFAGWTAAPEAVARAVAIGGAGAWACGTVSPWMDRDEPAFTRAWLPDGGAPRLLARGLVVGAWLQPAALLPAVGLWIRHGLAGLGAGLIGVEAAICGAALLGVACRRLGVGALGYAPVAAVLAGLGAAAAQ